MRKKITTKKAPPALGAYSQGIVYKNLVFTSGQLPIDPRTGEVPEGGIEIQTVRALENLKAILTEAGSSLENVVKTTIYLSDMSHLQVFNEVYACYFISSPPARSCVETSCLPKNALVEIEAIGVVDNLH